MTRRWQLPATLVSFAIVGTLVFVVWGAWIEARVPRDVFKALTEAVLVAGLGGVASLVLDEVQRARDQRDRTRQRLRTALTDLVGSYNAIKALRRRLRAEAIRPNSDDPAAVVNRSRYAALLRRLNDAQLNIEAYVRLIEGNKDLYADSQVLIGGLRKAEKYLGMLITEWENCLGTFQGTPPEQSLAKLQHLRCFVGDASMSFGPSFTDPMSDVLVALGRAIGKGVA